MCVCLCTAKLPPPASLTHIHTLSDTHGLLHQHHRHTQKERERFLQSHQVFYPSGYILSCPTAALYTTISSPLHTYIQMYMYTVMHNYRSHVITGKLILFDHDDCICWVRLRCEELAKCTYISTGHAYYRKRYHECLNENNIILVYNLLMT